MHDRFLALHHADTPLLIANAWDAASTALWQHAGAQAIGTSSAALAWACGYADGGPLDHDALIGKVREITRVARVPVSIDFEDGYSDDPAQVAAYVRELSSLGVVGINLEDAGWSPDLLVAKIEAIRGAMGGTPFFINARTDVYLRGMAKGEAAVAMTNERLARYATAGASGVFVPGLADLQEIAAVASATSLPLNVMIVPGLAPLDELHRAGVRRVSAGINLFQHAFAAGLQAARAFLGGDVTRSFDRPMTYDELNALFDSVR
ncbi:PEP phosphonomutase-like enzyme [Lysobacter dokdonensis DS-58]|uniref:PEP phosphonomutase-like enzyme n=1 Tax=Lysobacter dokdonensis DS-58 TaxID=1300345 RepID=A0A0A2WQK4_9GAMM|nr:isocitrate lyase/phosphoenolpyruvate mutase family protein [Lysobacter dokdonensis]KGQ20565.1 PEP phosphonomutase-like enzyme [Lysobacter dokdonensis DS-58]